MTAPSGTARARAAVLQRDTTTPGPPTPQHAPPSPTSYIRQLLELVHRWAIAQTQDEPSSSSSSRPFAYRSAFHQAIALYLGLDPDLLSWHIAVAVHPHRLDEITATMYADLVLVHLNTEGVMR